MNETFLDEVGYRGGGGAKTVKLDKRSSEHVMHEDGNDRPKRETKRKQKRACPGASDARIPISPSLLPHGDEHQPKDSSGSSE